MNIYEKLQNMRVELQQKNIKKSGFNKYAGYHYFELADILPAINELQVKYKTFTRVWFDKDQAKLTVINTEKLDETIEFISPLADLSLKGAHAIQNIGGVETYSRRYLYLIAFEIVEADYFDSVQGKPDTVPNYRNELIQKLKEKGIDLNTFAKQHKLNANTPQDKFKELIKELG